jgi:hypothetical protein
VGRVALYSTNRNGSGAEIHGTVPQATVKDELEAVFVTKNISHQTQRFQCTAGGRLLEEETPVGSALARMRIAQAFREPERDERVGLRRADIDAHEEVIDGEWQAGLVLIRHRGTQRACRLLHQIRLDELVDVTV